MLTKKRTENINTGIFHRSQQLILKIMYVHFCKTHGYLHLQIIYLIHMHTQQNVSSKLIQIN